MTSFNVTAVLESSSFFLWDKTRMINLLVLKLLFYYMVQLEIENKEYLPHVSSGSQKLELLLNEHREGLQEARVACWHLFAQEFLSIRLISLGASKTT